jgi:N-dimethylarginine dimethylaminohydrolase
MTTDARAPARIEVDSEYAPLQEAIVGVPFIVYPDLEVASWVVQALRVVPETEARKARERSGKDSISIGVYDAMERENEALIAILERNGVKAWRPEVLTRERVVANFGEPYVRLAGISQQFTRDPVVVIGDEVIECTMGSLYRRSDILGLARPLLARVMGSGARWVSMPAVDLALAIHDGQFDKNGFPALEGGDVLVLGRKILVGTSANPTTGSSELGVRWLAAHLAPRGYEVERVRLPEDILHLDVALSVPRPGLVVVCPEVFLDGIPACFDGWDRIEVSREEARHLGTNGLPIDERRYVLGVNGRSGGDRVGGALEARGIEVFPVPFSAHSEHGGSIRCSTLPLRRPRVATSLPAG